MAGKARRRVTAAMVARHAGVSVATVSYVINDAPNQTIPDATRERVWVAVRELDYTPSAAARALKRGRNDAVLLLLPDWPASLAVSQFVDEVTSSLAQLGLRLVIERDRSGSENVWRQLTPVAVLAFGDIANKEREAMTSEGIIVLQRLVTTSDVAQDTTFSQKAVGAAQVRHLLERGHRRIGYAGPSDVAMKPFSALRMAGAGEVCADEDLPEPIECLIDADGEGAATAIEVWRQASPPVTGVAAFNDEIAAALLAACRKLAVEVPADLAIVGVDDQPMSQFTDPPLTSVRQDPVRMAAHVAELVKSQMIDQEMLELQRPAIDLIRREST